MVAALGLLIGAIAIPFMVIQMPEDSFSNAKRQNWLDRKPAMVRVPLLILKNLLALVLILLGIAMLVWVGLLARLQVLEAARHDLREAAGAGATPVEAADQPPVDKHLVPLVEVPQALLADLGVPRDDRQRE